MSRSDFHRVADVLSDDCLQGDVQQEGGGDFWILEDGDFLVTKEWGTDGGIYTVYDLSVDRQRVSQKLETPDVDEVVEYLEEADEDPSGQ